MITQKVLLVSGQIFLYIGQEQNCMCFINHGVLEVCMYRVYVYVRVYVCMYVCMYVIVYIVCVYCITSCDTVHYKILAKWLISKLVDNILAKLLFMEAM